MIWGLTDANSGSAAHGDYVFGWEGDSLQKAMDKSCNLNRDCPAAGLTAQTPDKYNACTIKQQAPEPVDGCELDPSAAKKRKIKVLTGVANNRAQGHAHGRDGHQGLIRHVLILAFAGTHLGQARTLEGLLSGLGAKIGDRFCPGLLEERGALVGALTDWRNTKHLVSPSLFRGLFAKGVFPIS